MFVECTLIILKESTHNYFRISPLCLCKIESKIKDNLLFPTNLGNVPNTPMVSLIIFFLQGTN